MKIREQWNKLVRYLNNGSGNGQPEKSTLANEATKPYYQTIPASLKLHFSTAANKDAIHHLFTEDVKSIIDPRNNVFKRQEFYFNDAIDKGHAALLTSDQGDIFSMAFGYPSSLDGDHTKTPPDFVEVGTVISTFAGFNTAKVVISAITLKQWWEAEPTVSFASAIKHDNHASIISFQKMGWHAIHDEDLIEKINLSCNQNIIPPEKSEDEDSPEENWFVLGPDAIAAKAHTLLEHMSRGTLYNKYSNEQVDLDLSALEEIGLTRPRLEAIAYDGITDKEELLEIKTDQDRLRARPFKR